MASPIENFSAVNAILLKDIMPAIKNQAYEKALLWRLFRGFQPTDGQGGYLENRVVPVGAMTTSMINNTLYFPIITGNTGGAGAVGLNNQVNYGVVPMLQGQVPLTTQTGAFLITEQVLNSPGVVKDSFVLSMEQTANSVAMDLNRQSYSDGSATLGTASATGTTSTTLIFAASPNNDVDYTEFAPANTWIQIGANTPVQITAVAGANSVTLAVAQSWAAGAIVYKLDGSQTLAPEFVGLGGMVGTGAYAGISAPVWSSYVDTNGGTASTFAATTPAGGTFRLTKAFIKASKNGSAGVILMNATEFAAYGNSLVGEQRFAYGDPLYGGWATLKYMGGNSTVILDFDCPDDRIYVLSPENLYLSQLKSFGWLPGEKGVLRGIPQTLNYEAIASYMGAIWTIKRNSHAVLTNMIG